MEATPVFGFPFPGGKDAPAGPAQIEGLAIGVEDRLTMLAQILGTIGEAAAPTPGQLIIVDGANHPAYKAATVDVTINSAGLTTIGNEKVSAAKLANLAVQAAKLAAEAVETGKLMNLAVTTAKLANLGVTAEKLAAEAVETGKIKARNVTGAKIALEAVITELIANEAVTTAKLAALAVTEPKLGAGSVGSTKVGQSAKELFPQLYPTMVGGNRYINWGTVNQFVETSGRGVTVGIFPGFAPSSIQFTGFIAENYGGVFDYHITYASGGQVNVQAYSGALPGAVTITIFWQCIA